MPKTYAMLAWWGRNPTPDVDIVESDKTPLQLLEERWPTIDVTEGRVVVLTVSGREDFVLKHEVEWVAPAEQDPRLPYA